MPDQQSTEKSYKEEAADPEAFLVRTMKKDIERLRQGLPIYEAPVINSASSQDSRDASRRLGAAAQAHSPQEQAPKETAMNLPKSEERSPVIGQAYQPQPISETRPVSVSRTVPPQLPTQYPRPIETLQPQGRPIRPETPRDGKIEVENTPSMGAGNSIFQRILPTRKRLLVVSVIFLIIIISLTYALFAYFGKPLPGARFIFTSETPDPSALKTPLPSSSASIQPTLTSAPTQTPAPSQAPSPTPVGRASYLPVSRLALVDLPENATKVDLIERLTGFANIAQNPGDFTQVIVRHQASGTPFGITELFAFLGIATPDGFSGELSEDSTLFFYEPRDAKTVSVGHPAPAHFGIIIPIKGSLEAVKAKLNAWEATMGGDIASFGFGREWILGQNPFFESNLYQGTLIRYQNYPDPYVAADYAVFEGSTPALLVITTSRESMFSVIGTLNYRSE